MITIRYDDLKLYYSTMKYDIWWNGYCIYDGLISKFITRDLTDYDKQNAECPCCSIDDPTDEDFIKCICENYKDVYVDVYPLNLFQRISVRFEKYIWFKIKLRYYHLKFYYIVHVQNKKDK